MNVPLIRLYPTSVFVSPGEPRRAPIYCAECGEPTKKGKPFCSKHIMKMPYARRIKRDAEGLGAGE